ncbi:YesK family protein [Sporosarcina sp. Marseille-Q4943]|uniref:YesK family protein n=1 Tax=Sporosarcina sp. Marseille-Q4943 TaxID=2942204 RepID=UPI00208DA998|nr:YesK family protein [Sporosarcina sp. Marseille-Q4943]
MDIFIPIGLGFVINLLVFIISKSLKQTNDRSLQICLFAFLAFLLTSLLIGSWWGMGLGVISFGMLILLILIGLVIAIIPSEKQCKIFN